MTEAITRRTMLLSGTALAVAGGTAAAARAAGPAPAVPAPSANRSPLAKQPFSLLPTGTIKPSGWLRRQLEIQARGMGGRLDETWPDVGPDSGWLGGKGESWERGPYFLDGLIPLAWQLDDPVLKAKAQRFVDWTLDNPWPNGMIGPRSNDDWWPRMMILKALTQYHELTGGPRVIPVMTNYFVHQLGALPERPLRDWGRFRWQDEVVSIVWLYNRTGDARLIELARLLKQQGFDWQGFFTDFPYRKKVTLAEIALDDPATHKANALKDPALSVHGVNNAQGLKASPVWSLFSAAAEDREAIHRQLGALDKYHGLPIGIYSADEHFAGRSPSQGVELCAIVETLFSLEHALAITGDARLGDRIQRIAYNALPAAFTDDMWAHQYDQQPNQVQCSRAKRPWTTNGPVSNLFGLDPHFGCCTANFHQAWPKLTSSLWLASSDGGWRRRSMRRARFAVRYVELRSRSARRPTIRFATGFVVHVAPERPLSFPLSLRMPEWCATQVRLNGRLQPEARPGSFALIERKWRKGDRVEIIFANAPASRVGFNGSTSFEHAPLVFALPVEERWSKWRDRGLTADWEVFPESEWRFGVQRGAVPERIERKVGPVPFSRRSPAAVPVVEGLPVAGWEMVDGSAAPVPAAPKRAAAGRPAKLLLLPYAAPKLRITSFPTFGREG